MKRVHLIQSSRLLRRIAAGALLAFTSVVHAAEPVTASLEAQLAVEERLLERAREQYREARDLERRVLRDLQNSSNTQDALLDNVLEEVIAPGGASATEPVSLSRLRSAERELAGTRETALTLAREGADRRHELLARAERIRELRLEIARQGRDALVEPTGLDGRWRIELDALDITGTIDFDSRGTLVTGSYRLADGSQGSVRGTLVGTRLNLDRIDFDRGFDTNLHGDLNGSAGVIEGTWTAVDVSGGAPGSGAWRAVRVRSR